MLESTEKNKLIMSLLRAEIRYLDGCGWIMYCGTVGEEFEDPDNGGNKHWAHPDNPKSLMTQRQAIDIQRKIDGF